jgi:hypothetical protein
MASVSTTGVSDNGGRDAATDDSQPRICSSTLTMVTQTRSIAGSLSRSVSFSNAVPDRVSRIEMTSVPG